MCAYDGESEGGGGGRWAHGGESEGKILRWKNWREDELMVAKVRGRWAMVRKIRERWTCSGKRDGKMPSWWRKWGEDELMVRKWVKDGFMVEVLRGRWACSGNNSLRQWLYTDSLFYIYSVSSPRLFTHTPIRFVYDTIKAVTVQSPGSS